MAVGGEFVDGWQVAQVLGEGTYGEVRLLVHGVSGARVALKAVAGGAAGAREAALHGALRHAHVLRCLGARQHLAAHYLFLEFAAGGELFERIEPDVGMPARAARRLWRQLLAGLRYLHARGVAHRDIKPENLLLADDDTLKIADFGMATLFRHGSRERLLTRVCGTVPYAAPEVVTAAAAPYRAPPADLWAAALVLLAMLTGELPWERASPEQGAYGAWARWAAGAGAGAAPPGGVWRRVSAPALALLRRALHPEPARRAALPDLATDPWLLTDADADADTDHTNAAEEADERVWSSSQPVAALSAADMEQCVWLSQPEAEGARPPGETLVRRVTRLWTRAPPAAALAALAAVLDDEPAHWRRLHHNLVSVEYSDGVRMRVCAVAAGAGAGAGAMLEFRRSRGCGLAFRRRFRRLRSRLAPHALAPIAPTSPGDTATG